jgi:hypothetical protein
MAAAAVVAAGCDGCDHGTIYHPDFSGEEDLAVPLDLGVHDLRTPDLSVSVDMVPDLRLPSDAMRIVNNEMYLENLANAVCSNMVTCGRLDNSQFQVCKDVTKAGAAAFFDIDSEIAKSRMQINDILCITARQNARCDGTDVGQITANGPCGNAGFYVPLVANGNDCLASVECKSGYCSHSSDGGTVQEGCSAGKCHAFLATCDYNRFQAFSPECDQTTQYCATDGTCKTAQTAGQTCDVNTPCRTDLYCKGAFYGATSGTCTAATKSGALNDRCDSGQYVTVFPPCLDGLYCKNTFDGGTIGPGVCATKLTNGAPCNIAEVTGTFGQVGNPCADGLECHQIPGDTEPKCHPLGSATAACNASDSHCKFGLNCITGTCQAAPKPSPAPLLGDSCLLDSSNPCAGAVSGTITGRFNANCLPVPDAGAGGTGRCVLNVGWGQTCVPGYDVASAACASWASGDNPCAQCAFQDVCVTGAGGSRCLNFCPP